MQDLTSLSINILKAFLFKYSGIRHRLLALNFGLECYKLILVSK